MGSFMMPSLSVHADADADDAAPPSVAPVGEFSCSQCKVRILSALLFYTTDLYMKFDRNAQQSHASLNRFADIPGFNPSCINPDRFDTFTFRSFPDLSRATLPANIVSLPVKRRSLLAEGGWRDI